MNPFDLKSALLARHAQHVVLIHFPIALFITSVAFDVTALWNGGGCCLLQLAGSSRISSTGRGDRPPCLATSAGRRKAQGKPQAAFGFRTALHVCDLADMVAALSGAAHTAAGSASSPAGSGTSHGDAGSSNGSHRWLSKRR